MIWLHEDALRADHPVFTRAPQGCTAWFIWDENYLRTVNYSFKRLTFIYETLADLPVEIVRGPYLETLATLASYADNTLWVPDTVNPQLTGVIAELAKRFRVNVVEDTPFVHLRKEPDLKRFFRYWKSARKPAMTPGGTLGIE